jgi:hypothetical protein
VPRRLLVEGSLAEPSERIGRDFREAPPKCNAAVGLAQLNDILALRPADLPGEVLSNRIAPDDVPRIDARVVDA